MRYIGIFIVSVVFLASCRDARIHEEPQWGDYFAEYGIDSACFILRDNNHEAVHYYNKDRCLQRFSPASTFKIFNSLVALDIPKVPDESFVIPWDSVERWSPAWNKDMDMREAFKVSNLGYYQALARRIGADYMQHYLDTANYGNKTIGGAIDSFWIDGSLQISADEQVGMIKRLYFNQLPFDDRSQRIVRSMMLQEDSDSTKLYYKTGWGMDGDKDVIWVVGFVERVEEYKEHENSMNKSDERRYPYFFAMNFAVAENDQTHKWFDVRIDILKKVLKDHGAMRRERG